MPPFVHRPPPTDQPRELQPLDDDDPPTCGWHESSYELRRGLEVIEHGIPDQLDPSTSAR
jgi:hypothetical protein